VEVPHGFSVPLIASLEKGKYYLQLGAFSRPESVESAIAAMDKTYPLAVQSGGNSENPLYRILVGPLNLGESGAALQRFKVSGYKDAFVRKID
jgi:cell division septation protein DedD